MRQIEANEVETFFFQIINLDGFLKQFYYARDGSGKKYPRKAFFLSKMCYPLLLQEFFACT